MQIPRGFNGFSSASCHQYVMIQGEHPGRFATCRPGDVERGTSTSGRALGSFQCAKRSPGSHGPKKDHWPDAKFPK